MEPPEEQRHRVEEVGGDQSLQGEHRNARGVGHGGPRGKRSTGEGRDRPEAGLEPTPEGFSDRLACELSSARRAERRGHARLRACLGSSVRLPVLELSDWALRASTSAAIVKLIVSTDFDSFACFAIARGHAVRSGVILVRRSLFTRLPPTLKGRAQERRAHPGLPRSARG